MTEAVATLAAPITRLRDLVELGKPRITLMVLVTTAVGVWLAPAPLGAAALLAFLASTAALVASANTLNCWIERDSDGLMRRTRDRALPARRLAPRAALASGLALGAGGLAGMALATNWLTVALGALALVSYVAVYTPLKRRSWTALLVGAVPGALPPLMGWTAASGRLDTPGWLLFAILFAWQLPHFVAISLYLKDDYRRGGLRVLPVVHGDRVARRHLFGYAVALVAVSLAGPALGVAGWLYAAVAVALGVPFLLLAAHGLRHAGGGAWARRVFLYTLVHLPLLIGALLLDAR